MKESTSPPLILTRVLPRDHQQPSRKTRIRDEGMRCYCRAVTAWYLPAFVYTPLTVHISSRTSHAPPRPGNAGEKKTGGCQNFQVALAECAIKER